MKFEKRYIGVCLLLTFLVLFIIYFLFHVDDFQALLNINIWILLILFALQIIIIFINSVFTKLVLYKYEILINIGESFYLSVITTIGNYLLPFRGGAGIRAVYLKKKYDFPISYFISTMTGTYILMILIYSGVGLMCLLVINTVSTITSISLILFFIILFSMSLFLSLKRIDINIENRFRWIFLNKVRDIIHRIFLGLNQIFGDKMLLWTLIFIILAIFMVSFFISYFLLAAIEIKLSFFNILLYTSLSGLSLLISLTPASIGIKESIFVIYSNVIGLTNVDILKIALIERGSVYCIMVVSFLIVRFILKRRIVS